MINTRVYDEYVDLYILINLQSIGKSEIFMFLLIRVPGKKVKAVSSGKQRVNLCLISRLIYI